MPSIERGTFYLIVAKFIFFVTGYLIYFVLGKFLLSPAEFGIYGVVIAVISIIDMVLISLMEQPVSKFISEQPNLSEIIKRKAMKFQFFASIVAFFAFLAVAPFVAALLNDASLTPYLQLAAFFILFLPIFSIFGGYLNGLKEFVKQAKLNIFYVVVKMFLVLSLTCILIPYGLALYGAIFGFLISAIVGVAAGFYYVRFKKPTGSFNFHKLVDFSVPIVVFTILTNFLINIDLFAVKALTPALSSDALAGYYIAALTIARAPIMIILATSLVLFPLVSSTTSQQNLRKTRFYIENAVRYSLLVILPVAFLVSATSEQLIPLLFTLEYLPAATALSVLILGLLFYSLFIIFATAISGSNRPWISVLLAFGMVIVSLALNLFLVPNYLTLGAAVATTTAMFLGFLVSGIYVLWKFKTILNIKSFIRILFASIVIYVIALKIQISGIYLIAGYLILLALYVLVLYFMREFKKQDLDVLKNMFGR